jgi:hypothetical protein
MIDPMIRSIHTPLSSIMSLLCLLSAKNNADNTDSWKYAKFPYFLELVEFSLTYWLLML